MRSLHPSEPNRTPICYFAPSGVNPAAAWRLALDFIERAGSVSKLYSWWAYGSERPRNRNLWEESSGADILRALQAEKVTGWCVHATSGTKTLRISLDGPWSGFPWQHFSLTSQIPDLPIQNPLPLVEELASVGELALAVVLDARYGSWQRCSDLEYYSEHFGSTEGLRIIRKLAIPPIPERLVLDTSTNPGRNEVINGGPAMVAADMWLGPAFWEYAPCTRKDVIRQRWLEVRDTESFLYIKAYPEPFTRPDGEQGEIQRRLWKQVFHSDCRWPPGGNASADLGC